MSLDLAPEIEKTVREYAAAEGVSVNELMVRHFPPRKEVRTPASHVQALLEQRQKEYGLPPRPDGKAHSTLTELFDAWEAEDANLSPEQIEQEVNFAEEYERRERQSLSI
jgi:hypothetical protein